MVPRPLHFSSRSNSINSWSTVSQIINREEPSLKIENNEHVALENWGYPGYLSDEEFAIYVSQFLTIKFTKENCFSNRSYNKN